MLPLIPFFLLFAIAHQGLRQVIKNESIHLLAILVNIGYLITWFFHTTKPSEVVIDNLCAMIIAYYVYDIVYQDMTNQPNKYVYIKHHIVTIMFIYAHVTKVLPIDVGTTYLTLFEFSNTFLLIFTFFHKQNWKLARNITAFPFVLTYVPLRVVAIPLYSLRYVTYIGTQILFLQLFYYTLIIFLNAFSMYYGIYIAKKFVQSFMVRQ
jgi:hypothetical protein